MNQLVLVALLATAPAASAELTAEQIAKQALDNNMFSTANAQADVNLTMSKNGKVVRERRIITKVLRVDGEVRSFVEFTAPSDVAGTRFLSVEEKGGDADQYIYLPAFKKVKRVVGSQRTRSFMGTDFSYADLDGRDPDAATYKRLADEKIGGQDCYVLEATPKHPQNEDYGKSVVWVHKKHMIPMKIDFYGKKGARVKKRFTVRRLEKKDGRWVATDSKMATLSRSTATQLVLVKVDFDQAIDPADLTRQALER